MSEQNFKTHKRYHPIYHYFFLPLILTGFIYSGIRLFQSTPEQMEDRLLSLITFLLIFIAGYLIRIYALTLQNRLIRTEENFRHYLLTGKPLDSKLRLGQVIALRFASDAELPELAKRAISEQLDPKQIKEAITNWRPDHKRV